MKTVKELALEIVQREGGFVDDPDDPGGPTNWGVTLRTMQEAREDVTGDGVVDVEDVRALTPERAAAIFIARYFNAPRLGLLPEALQPPVFDMQVNAGRTAVGLLQAWLNGEGFGPLVEDGRVGPRTAGAARQAVDSLGERDAVDGYGAERREWYYRLADRRPSSRKYAMRRDGGKGGWIVRAEEFMSEDARLTDEEHRARTALWRTGNA